MSRAADNLLLVPAAALTFVAVLAWWRGGSARPVVAAPVVEVASAASADVRDGGGSRVALPGPRVVRTRLPTPPGGCDRVEPCVRVSRHDDDEVPAYYLPGVTTAQLRLPRTVPSSVIDEFDEPTLVLTPDPADDEPQRQDDVPGCGSGAPSPDAAPHVGATVQVVAGPLVTLIVDDNPASADVEPGHRLTIRDARSGAAKALVRVAWVDAARNALLGVVVERCAAGDTNGNRTDAEPMATAVAVGDRAATARD